MGSTLLRAGSDSWVDEAAPQHNHGQAGRLRLRGTTGNRRQALLFFARPFPLGATVLSATLRFYLAGGWGGDQQLAAARITEKWKEGRVKWARKPDVTATHGSGVIVSDGSDKDQVEIDVTAMMNDVAAGADWHGVLLFTDESSPRALYSSEYPKHAFRPHLKIEWAVNTDAPVNLLPSGGLAVSPAQPVLSWQFADKNLKDATDQSASHIQIANDPSFDFGTVGYDTGKEANALSHWDLSEEAGAFEIDEDDTAYWRVRTWDEGDARSNWSATASFVRKSHGTLTIDNPSAPPDNFVEETTPPIAWTFTGRTQEAWSLQLVAVADNGNKFEVYTEPRTSDDDDTFTLPKGLLKSGRTYGVRIRVWDTIDRIAIHGDRGYVEAYRQFTYQRDGTPVAVTDLVATPDGARMVLSFERTTRPDYFCLVVDNKEIDDRIDPDDIFVSGETYQLDYWGCLPRERTKFEVEAVVVDGGHHKHSSGNAIVHAKTDPDGIWLVDPADSVYVKIVGQDGHADVNLSIREVGTTYDVLGARRPVRITDALMGYSGSVAGVVEGKDQRDDFLELKGRLQPLRLILSDLNIRVELEESGTTPTPLPGDKLYLVETDLFQVDESFEIAGG